MLTVTKQYFFTLTWPLNGLQQEARPIQTPHEVLHIVLRVVTCSNLIQIDANLTLTHYMLILFLTLPALQIILQIIFILGDGRCTVWSSSKIRSSFQAIISCDQRKSFKNMISAFSVPSQAYLSLVGLLKVINIFCNGNNKNVLPQLAGPTIKIFLNLPLPLLRSSLMAGAKATHSILFPWRTSRA